MFFTWLTEEILPPSKISYQRLANEIKGMLENPEFPEFPLIDGPIAEDKLKWQFTIAGPPDSPYRGGDFLLTLYLAEFPFRPPQITFLTKVFHPNINNEGSVSLSILDQKEWTPVITVTEVLMCVFSLLEEPDLDNALVPKIAGIFKKDRSKYDKIARDWTEKYAMNKNS